MSTDRHEFEQELSPFQTRAFQADGNRIVLQDRKTGSSELQAALAARALEEGRDTLHISPYGSCESDFFDYHFPKFQDMLFHVRETVSQDDMEGIDEDTPGRGIQADNGGRVRTVVTRDRDEPVDFLEAPDLLIVDQPQWVPRILTPEFVSGDTEIVLCATGNDRGGFNMLRSAVLNGGFDLIWTDLKTAEETGAHAERGKESVVAGEGRFASAGIPEEWGPGKVVVTDEPLE